MTVLEEETQQEQGEHLWACEYDGGCPREPFWLGLFRCTCITAFCTEHREGIDREFKQAARRTGLVNTNCDPHGKIGPFPVEYAVTWSPF